jgi:hypothetical protein
MHKSRLGVIVIDCQTDDLTEPLAYWSAALGYTGEIDARGKYATFDKGYPRILLQAVDHAPRVHVDMETDNQDAEVARLEGIGATIVDKCEHGWTVMEAPTGHRFCVVNPQGSDLDIDSKDHSA